VVSCLFLFPLTGLRWASDSLASQSGSSPIRLVELEDVEMSLTKGRRVPGLRGPRMMKTDAPTNSKIPLPETTIYLEEAVDSFDNDMKILDFGPLPLWLGDYESNITMRGGVPGNTGLSLQHMLTLRIRKEPTSPRLKTLIFLRDAWLVSEL